MASKADTSLKELMEMSPSDLAYQQYEKLKAHTLERLAEVSKLIEDDKYTEALELCGYSPSGDGHGLENTFIDFGYADVQLDISEMCNNLISLRRRAEISDSLY